MFLIKLYNTIDVNTLFYKAENNILTKRDIKNWINNGNSINVLDSKRRNILYYMCGYGNYELVKYLLSLGIVWNIKDDNDLSPLNLAQLFNYNNIIELINKHQLKINKKKINKKINKKIDKNLINEFINSSKNGKLDDILLKKYLKNGGAINYQSDSGWSALMYASNSGNYYITSLLIINNANVNHQGIWKSTALTTASLHGYYDIVSLLIDNGADINHQDKDGQTALIWASQNGHIKVVKILIKMGADANHQNINGWTALMAACSRGHYEIAYLLMHVSDYKIKNNEGNNALDIAKIKNHQNIIDILENYINTQNLKLNNINENKILLNIKKTNMPLHY